MNFQQQYESYKALVDQGLADLVANRAPASLYVPTEHVLQSGGKRMRAVLVMLACDAVRGNGAEALNAGLAVEVLHNFTLVHDDIMDAADTRRGRATVHKKWDQGTAILVGDVMIGLAQLLLLKNPTGSCTAMLDAFARGIIDVCEGQALDCEFERRNDVTVEEYLHMIAMKTGRLAEMAAEIGGYAGNGTPEQIQALQAYARNIGIAFQIQDDLLDLTADEATLGKQIGRDIIEGKRTFLVVEAIAKELSGEDRALLEKLLNGPGLTEEEIPDARAMFERNGITETAATKVGVWSNKATECLSVLPDTPARDMLHWFAAMLMHRNS